MANVRDQYEPIARQAAQAAGIDENIFIAQITQESGWADDVVFCRRTSSAGAQGIAQFMPATAAGLGIDPCDPTQALYAAARYDRANLDRFGGDYSLMLAAYNAGAGAVQQYGGVPPFAETQAYVRNILAMAGQQVPAADVVGQNRTGAAILLLAVAGIWWLLLH